MSEQDEHEPTRGHSTVTDPHGTVGAGEAEDNHYSTGAPPVRSSADQTPEERAYNRRLYGLTWGERYRGTARPTCVAHCLQPGQRKRGARCPACYGQIEIRPLDDEQIEPGVTRAYRFAAWVGGWVGAFLDAVLFPFRVGREHHEAMVRDILRDALTHGLQVEALTDILTTLEGIEQELHGLRDAVDKAAEVR